MKAWGSKLQRAKVVTPETLAMRSRKKFRDRAELLLGSLAPRGAHTPRSALVVLERLFEDLAQSYASSPRSSASAWQEYGPEADLQAIRDAVNAGTVAELLTRYRARGGR